MALGGWFGGSSSSSGDDNSSSSTSSSLPPTPSPFSSISPSSGSASGSSVETKQRLQNAIMQQSNLINAKYLITKINENCFDHCVAEPGASLSSREQTCLSTCMEKYIDGWNVVSKTYVSRLQKEGAQLQAGGIGGGLSGGL